MANSKSAVQTVHVNIIKPGAPEGGNSCGKACPKLVSLCNLLQAWTRHPSEVGVGPASVPSLQKPHMQ